MQVRILSLLPLIPGCNVSPVRRAALEAGGQWFKSTHPDHVHLYTFHVQPREMYKFRQSRNKAISERGNANVLAKQE